MLQESSKDPCPSSARPQRKAAVASPVATKVIDTISRMAGETFGSNLTFGARGQASATGQLDTHTLRVALDGLHEAA